MDKEDTFGMYISSTKGLLWYGVAFLAIMSVFVSYEVTYMLSPPMVQFTNDDTVVMLQDNLKSNEDVLEATKNQTELAMRIQDYASKHPECEGKEHLLKILLKAGKDVDMQDCLSLPTWTEVTSMYGSEPVVYGLETCETYRKMRGDLEPDPRVGGLFNTGTNAFAESLQLNYKDTEKRTDYNAPGGKHTPLLEKVWFKDRRWENNTANQAFNIILIRDPFRWMGSMCKARYKARWMRGLGDHCPNLVPSARERKDKRFRGVKTFHVTVDHNFDEQYESLATMWSEWNGQYYRHSDPPRLIIRFEDTLFHAERVMEIIKECIGAPITHEFRYHMNVSKTHGHPTDFTTALSKYGRAEGRESGLTQGDVKYLDSALDPELMKAFHYSFLSRESMMKIRKSVKSRTNR